MFLNWLFFIHLLNFDFSNRYIFKPEYDREIKRVLLMSDLKKLKKFKSDKKSILNSLPDYSKIYYLDKFNLNYEKMNFWTQDIFEMLNDKIVFLPDKKFITFYNNIEIEKFFNNLGIKTEEHLFILRVEILP